MRIYWTITRQIKVSSPVTQKNIIILFTLDWCVVDQLDVLESKTQITFSHVVSPFVWSCVQTAAMARRNKTVIDDHPRIIVPATLPEYDTEWWLINCGRETETDQFDLREREAVILMSIDLLSVDSAIVGFISRSACWSHTIPHKTAQETGE